MGRIKELSEQLTGWIAAGEAVERPASVIKELMENAVDAHASAISVSIEQGGIKRMRVADNGGGIDAEDMPLAILKHATSKIYSIDDLRTVSSMGFRGEALASIAAVSMMTIRSRAAGAEAGTELFVAGGNVEYIKQAGLPEGTSVTVENLFYNTPARFKFMKKPGTEAAAISELVSRLILAYPEISVKYTANGATVYHSPGSGELLDSVMCVFGREAKPMLAPVDYAVGGIHVSGWCGLPVFAQRSSRNQCVFVNKRYIKSDAVLKAVRRAYTERLLRGSWPFCVLHISMPFSEVDPNVHPNKLTVHFADEEKLCYIVTEAVERALMGAEQAAPLKIAKSDVAQAGQIEYHETNMPKIPVTAAHDTPKKSAAAEPKDDDARDALMPHKKEARAVFAQKPDYAPSGASLSAAEKEAARSALISEKKEKLTDTPEAVYGFALPKMQKQTEPELPPMLSGTEGIKVMGAAFETYLIVQNEDTLYLIDQHAAHERLIYDELMKNDEIVVEPLLMPEVLTFSAAQMRLIEENAGRLAAMGVEIEPFGPTECRICALPALIGRANARSLMDDLLEALATGTDPALRREKLAKAACKRAVKAGEPLTHAEAVALVKEITDTGAMPHCPHGRPIAVAITKTELEKSFKRKV